MVIELIVVKSVLCVEFCEVLQHSTIKYRNNKIYIETRPIYTNDPLPFKLIYTMTLYQSNYIIIIQCIETCRMIEY